MAPPISSPAGRLFVRFESAATENDTARAPIARGIAAHAPDEAYDALRPHFSEKEIADLTILIGMINLWNRVAIGFRSVHPVEAGAGRAAE